MRRGPGAIAAVAALVVASPAAVAYQVPATDFTQGANTGTATMPGSNLAQIIGTSGRTSTLGATTAGARGTTRATYSPGIAPTTPAQDLLVDTGDCASTGPCANRGTVTITFSQPVTDPVLHFAGLGGAATRTSGGAATARSELHAIFTLTTSGVTLSKAGAGNNLAVTGGTTVTAADHDTGPSCVSTSNDNGPPAGATAACGSVRVDGTVTSLAFDVTAVFTKNPGLPPFNGSTSGDGVSLVASVGQDFGDAPASYGAGDAARAVLSNLRLGGAVSEDHATVANSKDSPHAGPGATGDANDDGAAPKPMLTTADGYTTRVALSGATKAAQVCGWIDFNRNGSFQPAERACAAVASGQTSATLTWNTLGKPTAGTTYARFRVGYTATQAQNPNGAGDSGEVEDYPFVIAAPRPPTARPDTATTPFNTPVTTAVLANDEAGDPSAPLVPGSVCIVSGATCVKATTTPQGSYTVNASGTVTFDPAGGFSSATTPVTYRVADGNGMADTATLVITVALPGKPAASPDTATTRQDLNVGVDPLANDTAGTGGTLVPGSVRLMEPDRSGPVTTLTVPGEGMYTVNAETGVVTFDPLPAFTGAATPVTYRVADDAGQTAMSTLTITVTPIRPAAADDANVTAYDTAVTTPVLANDEPGDPSAPLVAGSVCIVSGTACGKALTTPQGAFSVNDDGGIAFDPVPGFAGATTPITYRVADDNGTTDTATLVITVRLPNPPVAEPDNRTTEQNVTVKVDALSNDKAAPGVTLVGESVVLRDPADGAFKKTVTVAGEGTYAVNPDGSVDFDPLPSFTGAATSIGYRVSDSTGQTAESTIAISVTPVTPKAVSDVRTTPYETPVTVVVLENDEAGSAAAPLVPGSVRLVDPVSGDLVRTVTVQGEGAYTANADGSITFAPVDDYQATATSQTYQVSDGNGTPARAQLTVSVAAPAPPVANPDTNSTPQGRPVVTVVLGNDEPGPTGSALVPGSVRLIALARRDEVASLTVPGEGTYTVKADGAIDFQPVTAFTAVATPVTYQVADGNGATASSTLTITVTPVTPDAVDDTASTPYDTAVTVPLLANDRAGDPGVPLVPGSVRLIDPATNQPVITVVVAGEGTYTVTPDGGVTFDPLPSFTGPATPPTYQVTDQNGTTARATVTVTVASPPAPTVEADTGTTPQNVPVTVAPLANDSAGTGTTLDPASVVLIDPDTGSPRRSLTVAGEGAYTVAPAGTVTFDPLPAFTGPATPVTYRVADALGQTAASTITVTVTPITPQAEDDTRTTPYDTSVSVPVLGNDRPGGPSAPLVPGSVVLRDPADGGHKTTVTVAGEGTYAVDPDGLVRFDPVRAFSGATTPVTYRVADGNGTTDTAVLRITVGAPPNADPDSGTTLQDVPVTVDPLVNDTPGTGAALQAATVVLRDPADDAFKKAVTIPGEGTYTVAPDGKVTFDPLPAFTGTATPVTYRVADSDGNTTSSTIGITVTPVTPTAVDDAATTPFETPVTVPVLTNDEAGDPSSPLVPGSVELDDPVDGAFKKTVTIRGHGTYLVGPDGSVVFDPIDGFEGVTTPIAYRLHDDNETGTQALLTITVGAAPDADPDTGTTDQNVDVTVDPLTNDRAGTGATLVPSSVQVYGAAARAWGMSAVIAGEGTYTVHPVTGAVTFDPVPGFTGQSSVPYRVTDSDRHTAASTVTITVSPITPAATDDRATTPYSTPVTVPVAANDRPGAASAPLVAGSVRLIDPATGDPVGTLRVRGEGSFAVQPDGGVRFVPEPGFIGTTTPVTYRISDSNGTTATAALTVTVGGKPVAAPDIATTKQNIPVTVDPLANDQAGLDPSTLRLISPTSVAAPAAGRASVAFVVPGEGRYTAVGGKITFDPLPAFTGRARPVSYEVRDAAGNPARSTVTVTVTPIRPAAVDDARRTPYQRIVTATVLVNDAAGDPSAPLVPSSVVVRDPADATFKKVVTIPAVGVYRVGPVGAVTFTPAGRFSGTAMPVAYRVADANGTSATARLRITVGGPAGAKAIPDSGTARPGRPVVVNPLANDTPSEGARWVAGSVCLVGGDCAKVLEVPDVGTWSVREDGTIRFVSEPDFTGTAKVRYRVTDGNGVAVTSQVRITVGDQPVPPPEPDEPGLPETGGPSVLFFTLGGLLLAMGAALLGLARRRP